MHIAFGCAIYRLLQLALITTDNGRMVAADNVILIQITVGCLPLSVVLQITLVTAGNGCTGKSLHA